MKVKGFCKIEKEEQETNIVFDYSTKVATFYTSKKTIISRMLKYLSEPNELYYIGEEVAGATWRIPFSDKKSLNKIMSKSIVIGTQK